MTKTFERFLRSFTDDELTLFAQERAAVHPPYWKVMRLALQIELGRRGLKLEDDVAQVLPVDGPAVPTRSASA